MTSARADGAAADGATSNRAPAVGRARTRDTRRRAARRCAGRATVRHRAHRSAAGRLGAVAASKISVRVSAGTPGPGVADADAQRSVAPTLSGHLDPRRRPRRPRAPRRSRCRPGCRAPSAPPARRRARRRRRAVPVSRSATPRSEATADLGQQQRRDERVAPRAPRAQSADLGVGVGDLADEGERLLVVAELEQPEIVCMRLENSCACARIASVRPRTLSSSRTSASSSVRSRSVTTAPRSRPSRRTDIRLAISTRSPLTSEQVAAVDAALRAGRAGGRPSTSPARRPTASSDSVEQPPRLIVDDAHAAVAGRPRRRLRGSPCSVASRSCSRSAISRSSSPNVWRLSRRASSSEASSAERQRRRRRTVRRSAPRPPASRGSCSSSDADRDAPDDPAVGAAQRDLRARGAPQRPGFDRQHRAPRERVGRIGADTLADPRRVGVRVADPAPRRRPRRTTCRSRAARPPRAAARCRCDRPPRPRTRSQASRRRCARPRARAARTHGPASPARHGPRARRR